MSYSDIFGHSDLTYNDYRNIHRLSSLVGGSLTPWGLSSLSWGNLLFPPLTRYLTHVSLEPNGLYKINNI